MSGFNYLINLQVLNGNAFQKLSASAGTFESALERAQGEVGQTNRAVKKLGDDGQRAFGGLRSSVGGWVAGLGIAAATLGSLSTAADQRSLEKAITFAGGEEGARNLAFVRQEIEALKLPTVSALEGFKTLSGSLMGSGLAVEQQRDLFHAVAEASTVMGLSAQDSQLAFLAVGQMASKGRLQMEELRGQLGERIPGAFGIAARAMGVTTAEFEKMVAKGLDAKDFLPRFAAEMHKTFGAGVADALTGPRAAFNEFNNSVLMLRDTIGTELMPTATGLIKDFFIPAFGWIGRNIDVLGLLATTFGSVYVAAKLYAVGAGIASVVTGGFTGTIWGLNAALWANPLVWIAGALIAVGAAVVYAWNKFEGFRGFMYGMWEITKELGRLFWERVITPFMSFGKIVAGIFTFDTDLIASGMTDAAKFAESWSGNAGERIGNAARKGWSEGLADFQNDQSATAKAANTGGAGAPFGGASFSSPTGGSNTGGQAKEMASNITGGGQRNVTINVSKLTGVETLHTVNLKEGADRVGTELIKKLTEVLNSANQIQVSNG